MAASEMKARLRPRLRCATLKSLALGLPAGLAREIAASYECFGLGLCLCSTLDLATGLAWEMASVNVLSVSFTLGFAARLTWKMASVDVLGFGLSAGIGICLGDGLSESSSCAFSDGVGVGVGSCVWLCESSGGGLSGTLELDNGVWRRLGIRDSNGLGRPKGQNRSEKNGYELHVVVDLVEWIDMRSSRI